MSRLSRAGGARKVPVRYAEPSSVAAPLLDAALRAQRKGLLAVAHERYQQCLRADATCLDAWMNLAALQARAGFAREAADSFSRAAQLAANDGRVFRDIGVGLRSIGRLADAASALEHSVTCTPDLVGSWLHLARTRLEMAPRDSALDAARRAVELRPDDPSAHFLVARCAFDDQAPEQALAALQHASRCSKPYPEAEIFRMLLAWGVKGEGERETSEAFRERLAAVTRAHPHLSDLADAADHIRNEMGSVRVFASARDTLRFAASQAPTHGVCVELGVFHGVSLRWLVECRSWTVHGFDSFVGLPVDWAAVPQGMFSTAGRTPEGIDARLWVGLFAEQLPHFVASKPERLALLHVDSDLYESASCGLTNLAPLLQPDSVLVFDQYLGHRNWRRDEFRAFQEAVEVNGWRYDVLAVNPFTGQAVFRLRPSDAH